MKRFCTLILPVALALAACAPAASPTPIQPPTPTIAQVTATPKDDPVLAPTPFLDTTASGDLTRIDEQGMVVIQVTPANLGTPADTLDFDVAMNTHSVDLSMDLAAVSTLSTDTGLTIQSSLWDAPPGGGHHVSGKLIFPATQNGKSILEGAGKLTLTIRDVDAPARVFEWNLK
jgi:hypothetical protein